jgi:hypothetical protein
MLQYPEAKSLHAAAVDVSAPVLETYECKAAWTVVLV